MDFEADFKAAMFDFDGTITEKGVYYPSQEMADVLVNLANKMPIAFCTGRQLESFERHGLAILLEEIDEKKREGFLKNLHLMAENGSMGYYFKPETQKFEEFYRAKWPSNFVEKADLMAELDEAVKGLGSLYYEAHRIVIVVRTRLNDVEGRNVDEIYELSNQIEKVIRGVLEQISPDYGDYLHVGNSGIGVLVCPADGDKDTGIRKFAEYLKEARGYEFGPEAREILVVGDRPMPGGNDEYFLNGKYGTAYSVGGLVDGQAWPKPVIDDVGKRLVHEGGTKFLLREILNEL